MMGYSNSLYTQHLLRVKKFHVAGINKKRYLSLCWIEFHYSKVCEKDDEIKLFNPNVLPGHSLGLHSLDSEDSPLQGSPPCFSSSWVLVLSCLPTLQVTVQLSHSDQRFQTQ